MTYQLWTVTFSDGQRMCVPAYSMTGAMILGDYYAFRLPAYTGHAVAAEVMTSSRTAHADTTCRAARAVARRAA